jgi:hypothetical protein
MNVLIEDSYAESIKGVDSFDKYLHGIETDGYYLI